MNAPTNAATAVLRILADLDDRLDHLNNRYADAVTVAPHGQLQQLARVLMENAGVALEDLDSSFSAIQSLPDDAFLNRAQTLQRIEMEEQALRRWRVLVESLLSAGQSNDDLGIAARRIVLAVRTEIEVWTNAVPTE
jgi:hypothetical protein